MIKMMEPSGTLTPTLNPDIQKTYITYTYMRLYMCVQSKKIYKYVYIYAVKTAGGSGGGTVEINSLAPAFFPDSEYPFWRASGGGLRVGG